MPAYFEQGFTVRKPAWHGLATVLNDYPGREEAMKIAGHDFKVVTMPVLVKGRTENRPADGFKAVVHGKTGAIINIVRESYEVVQNETLWDVVDALVNQPNVKYETAGILEGGATLWVSAYLDEPIRIKGDDSLTLPFISASTTHDGSGALQAQSHMNRIVCANTKAMADSESRRAGTAFVFRHTKNVKTRIEEAMQVIRGTRSAASAYVEMVNALAELPISPAQHSLFLQEFIPMPVGAIGTVVSERVVRHVEAARLQIEKLFDGPTIPDAHRSTGYGLFLAGVEYLDHLRGYRNQDTYTRRTLLSREPAKDGLSKLITSIASN